MSILNLNNKTRKYSKIKKLYFSICLTQLFAIMLGEHVNKQKHLKKLFLPPLNRSQNFQIQIHNLQKHFLNIIKIIKHTMKRFTYASQKTGASSNKHVQTQSLFSFKPSPLNVFHVKQTLNPLHTNTLLISCVIQNTRLHTFES